MDPMLTTRLASESLGAVPATLADTQSSSNGTTNALGSGPGNTTTGQHTQRTRPTVLCAECKRLKTECDRKKPCQSCLGRQSEDKCVFSAPAAYTYSPAAYYPYSPAVYSPSVLERVDIQSLMDRMAAVEAAVDELRLAQHAVPQASLL
ncbi:hypothetical protein DFP72DRAFT_472067 [Ephemerocybe angulata]|uniref:Zn(2)-C6 fungal-type domain-containing protein n=1 Tax=Ephemerocybe angulata TaxID=980116 RepID=A0A8H6HSK7_9AGAR|nr:hypothetical protein DFP72DRAFT_472067 [Tulosesus angulatus]